VAALRHRHPDLRDEDDARLRDRYPTTTRCALCPWRHEGTAVQGREQAAAHRVEEHPELVPRPKHRRR
jgi:hypothetical protein